MIGNVGEGRRMNSLAMLSHGLLDMNIPVLADKQKLHVISSAWILGSV